MKLAVPVLNSQCRGPQLSLRLCGVSLLEDCTSASLIFLLELCNDEHQFGLIGNVERAILFARMCQSYLFTLSVAILFDVGFCPFKDHLMAIRVVLQALTP